MTSAIWTLRKNTSLRMTGTVIDKKDKLALDLTITQARGCKGTIGAPGRGNLELISRGNAIYVRPDTAFWKAMAAAVPRELKGKYIKTSLNSHGLGDFAKLCDVYQLAQQFYGASGEVKGATATIAGRSALQLKDTADNGSVWIATDGTPDILKLDSPGDGTLTFVYYEKPVTIAVPPASEVVDGKKYGM